MRGRRARSVVAALALCAASAVAADAASNVPGAGENAAFDAPARLAWRQFVWANAPVAPAGPAGAPAVLWESWAAAEEVFADPHAVPQWPSTVASAGTEPGLLQQALLTAVLDDGTPPDERWPRLAVAHATAERGEVRFNRTAFDWIVLKQLWYLEGQQNWFDLHAAGQPVDVDFPGGSVLVKAAWKPIGEGETGRFHWRRENGRLLGLTALHLTSKILPGWFWATFEHVDNPGRAAVAHRDPFGLDGGEPSAALLALMREAGLDPAVWANYRLDGTQTEYIDLAGAPIVLANSVIEAGFTALSSCRTCHVRATIGERGQRLPFATVVGAPEPAWFETPARPPVARFLRLDFAWSLARARARGAGPSAAGEP